MDVKPQSFLFLKHTTWKIFVLAKCSGKQSVLIPSSLFFPLCQVEGSLTRVLIGKEERGPVFASMTTKVLWDMSKLGTTSFSESSCSLGSSPSFSAACTFLFTTQKTAPLIPVFWGGLCQVPSTNRMLPFRRLLSTIFLMAQMQLL